MGRYLPVISAWNRSDAVAQVQFSSGHPEDCLHSSFV